jgi:hypothetical protein
MGLSLELPDAAEVECTAQVALGMEGSAERRAATAEWS